MDRFHGRDQKIKGRVSRQLSKNIFLVKEILKDCNDLVEKEFACGIDRDHSAYLCYIDGLAKTDMLEESIMRPLLHCRLEHYEGTAEVKGRKLLQFVEKEVLEMADMKELSQLEDVVTQILSGNTILMFQGAASAIMISSKMFPTRGVQAADQEVAIRGPKDSFSESLRTNTALIRRRIRDSRLKVEQKTAGERSKTDIALMYIDDLVRPDILYSIQNRLSHITMDGILDSGMLEQLLVEDWRTPFPHFQHTQRPDKTASALLEGRIVLVVDNSPDVLILPVTWNTFFQASDDYYNRWEAATFARILRYAAAFLAIGLPAFYIAAANFHTEILPTSLILSFAQARNGIPFPIVVEVLLMELEFELLREAGIRLPGQLGGTIGIVGGLIVGQAAVDAGIVSTIVVIVVSLTAIASFSIPNETMTTAFRLLKFGFIAMAALWGIYGFFLAWLFLAIHLSSLESFGVPYLMPTVSGTMAAGKDHKDYHFRLPLSGMNERPYFTKKGARIRRKGGKS
ncbi:MAG: spore germination protein [Lachnospiraceae bacterium]|nr:spore germination protein [Lachnospiraceae bacterium]